MSADTIRDGVLYQLQGHSISNVCVGETVPPTHLSYLGITSCQDGQLCVQRAYVGMSRNIDQRRGKPDSTINNELFTVYARGRTCEIVNEVSTIRF